VGANVVSGARDQIVVGVGIGLAGYLVNAEPACGVADTVHGATRRRSWLWVSGWHFSQHSLWSR
jgi:hypothetical protein